MNGNLNWLAIPLIAGALGIGFFYLDMLGIILNTGVLVAVGVLVFLSSMHGEKTIKSLTRERSRLEVAIENLSDGVIAYDQNFKILIFNRAAEQIFNLKAQEILGQSFTLKVKEDPSSRFRPLLVILFPALAETITRRSEPGVYPQIMDIEFNEPPLDLRVTTNRITDGGGEAMGFIKIVRDRTREVTLLHAKSEFITIASHQLRTPLTGLSWSMEGLKKEPFTPVQRELVENAGTATARLIKIVNDLLDVAKIEEGKFGYQFETTDIVSFLEEVLGQSKPIADSHRVKLYLEKPAHQLPKGMIDPRRLGIVVASFLDNAIRYNIPNGEVVMKVEAIPGKPYLEISVRDTGIGIAPQDMKKVFTEFFRGDNALKIAVEGTGLSLYIAKNIVRRHGGTIRAESTLNRGSKISFTLPTDPKLIPAKETVYGENV